MTLPTTAHILAWVHDSYGLADPLSAKPLAMGTNNRSVLVASGTESYILKWYRNVGSQERLPFEHALLGALATADLPFAVPSPVPTLSGDTSVEVTHDTDVYRVALFHRIPGRAAGFGSEVEAYRCGHALAILDRALGTVVLDPAVSVPATFGDLTAVHANVPEPLKAIQRVYGDHLRTAALADVVPHVEERWHRTTSGWRTQLIHGDFYPSNTMIDSGEVAGILDFEFSGMGYRPMDFSIGLAAFSTTHWDDGCSWPLLEAFAAGYLRVAPLTEEEMVATPVLLLMREASSFVHWLGRLEQGLTTHDDVVARADRLLALHRWLEAHQTDLVQRLLRTPVHPDGSRRPVRGGVRPSGRRPLRRACAGGRRWWLRRGGRGREAIDRANGRCRPEG